MKHFPPELSSLDGNDIKIILTDSRSLTSPGETVFFALRTPQNDGHRYISELYNRGVRNFVVERWDDSWAPDAHHVLVADTLKMLQKTASCHRAHFQIPVIGVTGSRGKTVVKEWLSELLSAKGPVTRSPRSYNSQIGVPLSVWELSESSGIGIFEAGISRPGEMDALEEIIKPSVAVITNVGSEHSESFPSRQALAMEKAKLAAHADIVVFDADDNIVAEAVKASASPKTKLMGFSKSDGQAPLRVSYCGNELEYQLLGQEARQIALPFSTRFEVENAITCLAVMVAAGIDGDAIARKISHLKPIRTRLEVVEGVNECQIFHDSYYSDLPSLPQALDFMTRSLTPGMKITAILSDLAHDGTDPEQLYRSVSQALSSHGVSRLIGVGPEFVNHRQLFHHLDAQFFNTTDELLKKLTGSDFLHEMVLVKGGPESDFESVAEMLEAKQHETVMEVNLDAMVSNFNFFRSRLKPSTGIICMLKASGYGAGSLELARVLQSQGAAYVAVAVHDEGVELRQGGVTMPIIVLNPKVENFKSLFSHHLEPEIYSFEFLERFITEAQRCEVRDYPIHIKLDTGMHRLGFRYEELPRLVDLLQKHPEVRPRSMFSHLCAADDSQEDEYTWEQFAYFDKCCDYVQSFFSFPILRHILNSTGITRFPSQQHDMVRLGIGLYGVKTMHDGSQHGLRPVSAVRSPIISLRRWKRGETIGYNRRGVLERDSLIATVPIGYADGLNRHLGYGTAKMLVHGVRCPIVGSVCMDSCMIDVTDVPEVKVGDMAEIFGDKIPIEELSDALGTIPYEILTSVSTRIKRVYYRE